MAKVIHNQISGASLNEKTKNRLRVITPENAAFVVQEYKSRYNVSSAKHIDDEWGLDVDTVKEFVCKKLAQQLKDLGIKLSKHYTEYSTIKGLEQWIDVASKAIIKKMENATETYYDTDTEATERTQQAEAKKIAKTSRK